MNLILVCSTNFKIYTQIQNVCVWWGEGGRGWSGGDERRIKM